MTKHSLENSDGLDQLTVNLANNPHPQSKTVLLPRHLLHCSDLMSTYSSSNYQIKEYRYDLWGFFSSGSMQHQVPLLRWGLCLGISEIF